MLKEEFAKRNLPMAKAETVAEWEQEKEDVKKFFLEEEYGVFPHKPDSIEYVDITEWAEEEVFFGDKADKYRISVNYVYDGRKGSFPFDIAIPKKNRPCPAFVSINFEPGSPYKYMPTEEIIDNGFAVASVCYNDITMDNGDMNDGAAGVIFGGRERTGSDPGKISIWAWAMSLVLDYIIKLDAIDSKNIASIGHSRLGKTALLAGAYDDRFAFVVANDSGCSGAAVSRGKNGETIAKILNRFPFWFAPSYEKYRDNETAMKYDQNMLISLVAPRKMLVASASGDSWADPVSEYIGAAAAEKVYALYGLKFAGEDRLPVANDDFRDGAISYHMRDGLHFLSRTDWNIYMDYIRHNLNK